MTREEAIEYLEDAKIKFKIPKAAVTARKTNEALDMAIKALEQEPKTDVLDKVKAEIKALSPKPTAYDVVDGNPIKEAVWETLADVLWIVDKYKGESEKSK